MESGTHSFFHAVVPDSSTLFGAETVRPSSRAQREVFNASRISADASRAHNHSISIVLEGPLDVDALYSSLLNLTQRHEALRGTFSEDGAYFRIRERMVLEMPVLDLSGYVEAHQNDEYAKWVSGEVRHVFDLVQGPLFTGKLIRFSAVKSILAFNCHQAVVDGWSLHVIMRDLPKLYGALVTGLDVVPLSPAHSFMKYLEETVAREKDSAAAAKSYWTSIFPNGLPTPNLPVDHARPAGRSYRSCREDYKIQRPTYEKLKALGTKNELSQFAILFSAFALYLHRITGQSDLVVGIPSAGQVKNGKTWLLGSDVRVLPIHCRLEAGDSFLVYANRLMERFYAAYEHQWISLSELARLCDIPDDLARAPLLPVIFNFDPGMKQEDFRFEGLKAHHIYNHREVETFELSVNAVVEGDEMLLECAYNADLFDAGKMHDRLSELDALMASIAERPDLPLGQTPQAAAETPFFFGPPEKRKFGTYYPGAVASHCAVLLCPPLGQEYMRTHWLVRNIAASLNRAGASVLRFDFYGQGDSSGDTEQTHLSDLTESLIDAVNELKVRSGSRQIQLIAFRASALVANHCRDELGPNVRVIFVDPPSSGIEYLNDLRTVQQNYWDEVFFRRRRGTLIRNSRHEELVGTLYARELLEDLKKLQLADRGSAVRLSISPPPGWGDHRKFDNIFLSPALIREIQAAVFGGTQ